MWSGFSRRTRRLHLTGAAILFSRGIKVLQSAPAGGRCLFGGEVSTSMKAPTSSLPDVPEFPRAVAQLQEFLGNEGSLHAPLWVFREDVASVRWRIWVRTPLPPANVDRAREFYEQARARGLGVVLGVLCLLQLEPCCYVCWPQDAQEAEYAMLSGLKLTIPHPLLAADAVGNGLSWWFRKWRESRCTFPSYVGRVPRRG
jgi:hypothetical protein